MLQKAKAVCKLKEGVESKGWLGLASKLEYYCCSNCYVTHPIKGDILQNPFVIINNHLPLQYAKWTTLGCYLSTSLVIHNIVNKSTLGQFSHNICRMLNVSLYFRTFKPNC